MTEPIPVATPDGRSLDVYLAGPEDGEILLFHDGSPGTGHPTSKLVAAAADRNLRYVSFSRPGYAGSSRRPGRRVAERAEVGPVPARLPEPGGAGPVAAHAPGDES